MTGCELDELKKKKGKIEGPSQSTGCSAQNSLLKAICKLMQSNGIWKSGTDEPACKAEIETQTQNKCMDTKKGKRGRDELGG